MLRGKDNSIYIYLQLKSSGKFPCICDARLALGSGEQAQ